MALVRKSLSINQKRFRYIDKIFKYTGYAVIIIYFLYASLVWLSLRPSIRITNIIVEGAHAVSAEAISATVGAGLKEQILIKVGRDNKFLYPISSIKQKVLMI